MRPLSADHSRPVIHGPWSEPDEDQNLDPLADKSKDVRKLLARRVFEREFADLSLSMEDMATQRTVVCWRVLRRWASLLGHKAAQGPARNFFRSCHPRRPLPVAEGGILSADEWEYPPALLSAASRWAETPLPLLPTELDAADAALYTDMILAVGDYLGIPAGARENKGLGRYGLKYLIDPDMVLAALPPPHALVSWEAMVVDTTMQQLTSKGSWGVVLWLRAKFALADDEAMLMIAQARAQADAITAASEDENRALMQIRLEQLADANRMMDPRVALQAAKTLAIVQGISRSGGAGGDDLEDWEDALAEVVDDDQQAAIAALGLDRDE